MFASVLSIVAGVGLLFAIVVALLWAFGVFGRLLLALEGRPLPEGPPPPRIELTLRDRELVANGWHPDDLIAARRNGIEIPDKPPY